jgi:hypothetical protein
MLESGLDSQPVRVLMAPDIETIPRIIGGCKERETVDMIQVGMGNKQIGGGEIGIQQVFAKCVKARSRIENEQVIVASNFQAGGVPAIANRFRAGAGQTSPYAPETNEELIH